VLEKYKSDLEVLCGGDGTDGAVDILLLRLPARLGNGRRNSDVRPLDDVLCRSVDAADVRCDVRPTSTLSSDENRLLLDRCLAADMRSPESRPELTTETILDDRRCPVTACCCSVSGVVRDTLT